MQENAIEIKNLTKKYKDFTLENISFNLPRGFIMGLVGPNGSGKTTTIKAIMNLVNADSGEINILGFNSKKDEIEAKNKIGFVYDDCYYYGDLSIDTNKNLISSFYKNWDDSKFYNYLEQFELKKSQKVKTLSKGMKMKFQLAMALSHNAEIIIMDEPTSGLDPVFRAEILDILYSLIENEEITILFSTHITSDLEKIADYITFINKGHLIFSLEKDAILENYKLVKGPKNILNEELKSKFVGIKITPYNFEGLIEKNNLNFDSKDCLVEIPTLEDIMVYYSKRSDK